MAYQKVISVVPSDAPSSEVLSAEALSEVEVSGELSWAEDWMVLPEAEQAAMDMLSTKAKIADTYFFMTSHSFRFLISSFVSCVVAWFISRRYRKKLL